MPIDFSKLAAGQHPPLISPRDVFAALPRRAAGFGYLRDVQGQVLDAWARRRTERDLLIKTNTGTGKTAVGLLMLQSSLNEGRGPALYVSPTTTSPCRSASRPGRGSASRLPTTRSPPPTWPAR